MTDTNQASELYELCKEVYEKTKWGDYYEPDAGIYDYRQDKRKKIDLTVASYSELDRDKDAGVFFEGGYPTWVAPLYTSDYLLEKLPHYSPDAKHRLTLQPVATYGTWAASYDDTNRRENGIGVYSADTPLKALLKLTIALSEAGELK